ncbi:hypothetical protein PoB_005661900 [Plakobranchus ocellatus]|uniref:Uncharacterized protein n=1 Tax=Plakobranchus ocellatus TaxID=259542 RepID=A0AAV4CG20_9GAST|nr:hypothetical protein PoB_005661900 [Plakobranchus ocellatus]
MKTKQAFYKEDISTAIREIDDAVQWVSSNINTETIALSVDYPKASDTISTSHIIHALQLYRFGKNFTRRINIRASMENPTQCLSHKNSVGEMMISPFSN